MRLQKAISRAGLMSRRRAEELIEQGRITIDGRVAVLGDRVDP
ncbi:MAG: pseudouridine synthase, partial [Actinobacteria bacterium]|nr:pseudouridine synthase [Actinomycetota bacterium]NIS36264.1 pseudouridine synthase [Actinomycetota bacterium]NIT98621.1 pseudouridine synthase [Actinomycetota bacterium]NIU70816.1 pseudouridine synthase [Actinomycetota bacterium]NIW32739.1 pseudouridine synthase [Actinomycetota bacterium]